MPRAITHGTVYRYKQGCRCAACRAAKNESMRQYVANVRARTGMSPTQKYRPAGPKRTCSGCSKATRGRGPVPLCKSCSLTLRRMVNVPATVRSAIYERDAWVCQFCHESVEPGLPSSSPWQATLDHVVPRSKGGTDAPENLRLLHRYCNAVRSNRAALTLAELAA